MKEAIEALFINKGKPTQAHVDALKGVRSLDDVTGDDIDPDAMDRLSYFLEAPKETAQGEADEDRRALLLALAGHLAPVPRTEKPKTEEDKRPNPPTVRPQSDGNKGQNSGVCDPRAALLDAFGEVEVKTEESVDLGEEEELVEDGKKDRDKKEREERVSSPIQSSDRSRRNERREPAIAEDLQSQLDNAQEEIRALRERKREQRRSDRESSQRRRVDQQENNKAKEMEKETGEEVENDNEHPRTNKRRGSSKNKGQKKEPQPPRPAIVQGSQDHLLARVHVDPRWVELRDYIFGEILIARGKDPVKVSDALWQLSELTDRLERGEVMAQRYPYNVRMLAAEMIISLNRHRDIEAPLKDEKKNWFEKRYAAPPKSA